MANSLSPALRQQFFANNGKPAAGYKIFTYQAGTDTKLDTYQSANGSVNSNPIILDFRGEANIWLPPNVAYKFVFAPPNDTDPPSSPIWTVDNVVDSQLVTLWGGVDTGIANAYVLDFTANFTSYTDGIVIYWLPSNTNTGPSTINVNGLGPVPITNQDGSPIYLGQLQANQVALIVYRSTGFTLVATALLPLINTENGNYTFQLSDANNIVQNTTDDILTLYTIPTNDDVPFPVGTSIEIIASGAAGVEIVPAAGVTFFPFGTLDEGSVLVTGHASTRITKVAPDTWVQSSQSNLALVAGSFAPSWLGFANGSEPSGALRYYKIGRLVTLYTPTALTGTSNATSMSITNVPLQIRPTALRVPVMVTDNGNIAMGMIGFSGMSTFDFYIGTTPPNSSGFTNSGTKGLPAGFMASWIA
jgi:hypothetical protein